MERNWVISSTAVLLLSLRLFLCSLTVTDGLADIRGFFFKLELLQMLPAVGLTSPVAQPHLSCLYGPWQGGTVVHFGCMVRHHSLPSFSLLIEEGRHAPPTPLAFQWLAESRWKACTPPRYLCQAAVTIARDPHNSENETSAEVRPRFSKGGRMNGRPFPSCLVHAI